MAERYATILVEEDGTEVVSNIAIIEGKPNSLPKGYKRETVPAGVKIGMVRGGAGEQAGGFGFPSIDATTTQKQSDKGAK